MRLPLRRNGKFRQEQGPRPKASAGTNQGFFAAPNRGERNPEPLDFRFSSHLSKAVRSPLKIVGTLSDIARDKRKEGRYRQAQKMEAIGRLTSGLTHDFNNLLSVIIGYTDLVLDSLPDGTPNRTRIERIGKAARRAADLTQQMLAFARKDIPVPRVIDPNASLTETEKLLRRLLPENIVFDVALASDVGWVLADPGQLSQIILNLATNARDAMRGGGTLRIETANAELDQAYARQYPPVKPGQYVQLVVIDSGSGMDRDTQLRLFEPFFTTKTRGKGTGLGLANTYDIVKQLGGYIWVYSEPGNGTTIKVLLPRTEKELITVMPTPAPSSSRYGKETILLVEDVNFLRESLRDILRFSGYTVLDAASGHEALATATTFTEKIHVVLSDVVMPSMSGSDFAKEIRRIAPGVKIVFMSGYSNDMMQQHVVDVPVLLHKPFTREALLNTIRGVLDGTLELANVG